MGVREEVKRGGREEGRRGKGGEEGEEIGERRGG